MNRAVQPLRDVLEEVHWMRDLPIAAKERVFAHAYDRQFRAGDLVARNGAPAHCWIGVAEGLLKVCAVHRTGKVVMFAGIPEGGWLGEGSVLKQGLFRYDVVAMRDSRVILFPGAALRALLDESIEFNRIIISHLNARLAQYIAMVEIDRMTDPVARVARAIGTFYDPVLYPHMEPHLSLSQTELGELIGMSRQSIAAACKVLEADHLLTMEYGGLLIRNLDGLMRYEERENF